VRERESHSPVSLHLRILYPQSDAGTPRAPELRFVAISCPNGGTLARSPWPPERRGAGCRWHAAPGVRLVKDIRARARQKRCAATGRGRKPPPSPRPSGRWTAQLAVNRGESVSGFRLIRSAIHHRTMVNARLIDTTTGSIMFDGQGLADPGPAVSRGLPLRRRIRWCSRIRPTASTRAFIQSSRGPCHRRPVCCCLTTCAAAMPYGHSVEGLARQVVLPIPPLLDRFPHQLSGGHKGASPRAQHRAQIPSRHPILADRSARRPSVPAVVLNLCTSSQGRSANELLSSPPHDSRCAALVSKKPGHRDAGRADRRAG